MRRRLPAAVTLLALVAACGMTEPRHQSRDHASDGSTRTPEIVAVTLESSPIGLTATPSGDVWAALPDDGMVVRLAAGGASPDAKVAVAGTPLRLAVAEDGAAVWVTAFRAGTVVRVDTSTRRVTDRVRVGAGAEGVAEAFGSVWVAAQDDGLLARIDPATRTVVHQVDVGAGVRLVVPGPDALWLADHTSGEVVTVAPGTMQVRRSAHVCDGPEDLVAQAGTVWLTCSVSEEVVALAADDLQVTQRVPLDGTPDAITPAPDGSLLVVLQDGPTLVRLDGTTGKELSRLRLGKQKQLYDQANLDVVTTGDDAWITSYSDRRVLRTPWTS